MKGKNVTTGGVHLTMNGYYVEGRPAVLISTILCNIPNLDRWSKWSLLMLYKGMIELMMDYCLEIIDAEDSIMTKKSAKNHYKKYKNRLKFMPRDILKWDGKDRIYKRIYEMILEGEELQNLRGFGFANNFGDSMTGNAETQSSKPRW